MAFTWADYLTVASTLNAAGDEASLRAAVSRAYYAVFGEAKEVAEKEMGEDFAVGSVHNQVVNYYDGSSDNARRAFAANLSRLKSSRVRADYFRVRADYFRSSRVDARFADQALAEATQLLNDLATLAKSENLP